MGLFRCALVGQGVSSLRLSHVFPLYKPKLCRLVPTVGTASEPGACWKVWGRVGPVSRMSVLLVPTQTRWGRSPHRKGGGGIEEPGLGRKGRGPCVCARSWARPGARLRNWGGAPREPGRCHQLPPLACWQHHGCLRRMEGPCARSHPGLPKGQCPAGREATSEDTSRPVGIPGRPSGRPTGFPKDSPFAGSGLPHVPSISDRSGCTATDGEARVLACRPPSSTEEERPSQDPQALSLTTH